MGNRVFLKRVPEEEKRHCTSCYIYENYGYVSEYCDDCLDDINNGKILKQIHFERVEGLCTTGCYFFRKEKCYFPNPMKYDLDCDDKGIYKLK